MDLSFEPLSTIIVSLGMSPVASGNTLRQLHKLLYFKDFRVIQRHCKHGLWANKIGK